ncbi:MAG: protein translocase subunit SecD [Parcubacteria group bacterium]|nr:protein translocase subunit SecD [Parcubacteria group bacterium]|tara:strand:+ start:2509 stop:3849 length:1341 start_codon:yes stop_codon:yes gene_type:complete
MWKNRLITVAILLVGFGVGWFVYSSEIQKNNFQFNLGLDLSGGTHLVYKADTSRLAATDIPESMASLRDTIERRVNLFGVAEPIVQTERGGTLSGETQDRLIIELPGVTDTQEAIRLIGETPVLEFRLQGAVDTSELVANEDGIVELELGDAYGPAVLTGAHLDRATLEFGQGNSGGLSNEPVVVLNFTNEGGDIFEEFTGENVGEVFGIFLDGQLISNPIINERIGGGSAVISGGFQPEEARELVRNLNFGALPLPIELLSSQTIGASLGAATVEKGIEAGLWGLAVVALFLLLWYRLPGLFAVISLSIYIIIMLALFKVIPITLTAAGLAGFILSIGLAVDANVLIFERMKEELLEGKWTHNAVKDGFARAWLSIRDGNLSSIITAVILFWFGTSLVEGFALVFGLGVIISMLTAITISRTLLLALGDYEHRGIAKFLFGTGLK